jgi:tetratricopeptide (TPR) repeat protein
VTRRLLACIVVALSLVHSGLAGADESDARAAMRRGLDAFERGDAEAALAEYTAAKRLAPAANAPYFYAAQALVRLERWREAVQEYETYLSKYPTVSDASEVRKRIAQIRSEHFPGRVRIVPSVAGGTVTVDGADRGAPGTFELPPGPHRIEVRAPAHEAVAQTVVVVADTEIAAPFNLPRAQAADGAPARDKPAEEPADNAQGPLRTAGWITAGVGAATFLTTLVLDAAVLGPKIEDYGAAADAGRVDEARALHDDASGLRTGLFVGYSVGAVLAVGGVLVGLLAPRRLGGAPAASLQRPFAQRRAALPGPFMTLP